MSDPRDLWADVVVAILAVNQYSLEKTYPLVGGLAAEGLANPGDLSSWTVDEIVLRLRRAGCDRGEFMTRLFAQRLSSLGSSVVLRGVEECTQILLTNEARSMNELLLPIKGIGPKVMENLFVLRGTRPSVKP